MIRWLKRARMKKAQKVRPGNQAISPTSIFLLTKKKKESKHEKS